MRLQNSLTRLLQILLTGIMLTCKTILLIYQFFVLPGKQSVGKLLMTSCASGNYAALTLNDPRRRLFVVPPLPVLHRTPKAV